MLTSVQVCNTEGTSLVIEIMINGIATEAVVDTATPRLTHSPTDDPHYSISTVVDPELPVHSPSSHLNPVGSHNSSEPIPSTTYTSPAPNSCSNSYPNSDSYTTSDSYPNSNSYPDSDSFRNSNLYSNPYLYSYSITCSKSELCTQTRTCTLTRIHARAHPQTCTRTQSSVRNSQNESDSLPEHLVELCQSSCTGLNEIQCSRLKQPLHNFSDVSAQNELNLGCFQGIYLHIHTKLYGNGHVLIWAQRKRHFIIAMPQIPVNSEVLDESAELDATLPYVGGHSVHTHTASTFDTSGMPAQTVSYDLGTGEALDSVEEPVIPTDSPMSTDSLVSPAAEIVPTSLPVVSHSPGLTYSVEEPEIYSDSATIPDRGSGLTIRDGTAGAPRSRSGRHLIRPSRYRD